MSKEITSKTKRIAQTLALLEQGPVLIQDLSLRFGVSFRTIQRDMRLLLHTKIPLISTQQSIYQFAEGFSLKAANLSCEKMALLALSFDIARQIGGDFARIQNEISKYFIPPDFDNCEFNINRDKFTSEDNLPLNILDCIDARVPAHIYLKDTGESPYVYILKLLYMCNKLYIATASYYREDIKYFPMNNIKYIAPSSSTKYLFKEPFIEWAIWKKAHKWVNDIAFEQTKNTEIEQKIN